MSKSDNDKKEKMQFFMEDTVLFSLWYFVTPDFYAEKDVLGLDSIVPGGKYNYSKVFDFLVTRLKKAKVDFPDMYTYQGLPNDDFVLPIAEDEVSQEPVSVRKQIITASQKFLDGDFSPKDLAIVSRHRAYAHEWIFMRPEFTDDEQAAIYAEIDEYIEKFLNDELLVFDRNYLIFEKQKDFFISLVRTMSAFEQYGPNFVLTHVGGTNDGFLFVHTLYALQKLGYLHVLRLWHSRTADYPHPYQYHANIVALEPLVQEVTDSFRKENPKTVYETYRPDKYEVRFAGKNIPLSKGKKETDAALLMATLAKIPSKLWYEDEVLEDWGYHDNDETAEKKVYFAARKINDSVERVTGINDFIDHNTKKFQINQKYLKVDE